MKKDAEVRVDQRERLNYLDILELATEVTEEEFGMFTFKFVTEVGTATMSFCQYDGDTSVALYIPAQSAPIASLDLADCLEIRTVNDKRGKYLEFVGKLRVERYTIKSERKTIGFRLYLEPMLCLEPFLMSED